MVINLSAVLKEIGSVQDFEGTLSPDNITYQEKSMDFPNGLAVKGSIYNAGEILELRARVRGTIRLQCVCCMELYDESIDLSLEVRLKKQKDQQNPDYYVYQGPSLDIDDIVIEHILLDLPIQRKCRDDCKGLCAVCGSNLNDGPCDCKSNEEKDPDNVIDERLKALKDYFST